MVSGVRTTPHSVKTGPELLVPQWSTEVPLLVEERLNNLEKSEDFTRVKGRSGQVCTSTRSVPHLTFCLESPPSLPSTLGPGLLLCLPSLLLSSQDLIFSDERRETIASSQRPSPLRPKTRPDYLNREVGDGGKGEGQRLR